MKKELIGILICTLLATVAITPSITAHTETITTVDLDVVESTDEIPLILSNQDFTELEEILEDLEAGLFNAKTEEEMIQILKEAITLVYENGDLSEDITLEEAQQIFLDVYNLKKQDEPSDIEEYLMELINLYNYENQEEDDAPSSKINLYNSQTLNLINNGNQGLNTDIYPPHAPIKIIGNENFTAENGVSGGSGTKGDPYIIENWNISDVSGKGILIKNTDAYFIIRNCNLGNNADGIRFENVKNGKIQNIIEDASSDNGIFIRYSENIEVSNSVFCNNLGQYGYGILCIDNSYITIESCEIYNKYAGINFIDVSYSLIDDTEVYNCYKAGILIYAAAESNLEKNVYNTIKDCNIHNNEYAGIEMSSRPFEYDQFTYTHIVGCEVYANCCGAGSQAAIWIHTLHGNIIEDCNVYDSNGLGIVLDWSSKNLVKNCSVFNNTFGGDNTCFGILILGGYAQFPSIWSFLTYKNEIKNCDIYDNDIGIANVLATSSIIQYNNIMDNELFGIAVISPLGSTITYNNIVGNGQGEFEGAGVVSVLSYANLRHNWWNSALGPSRVLPIRGDFLINFMGAVSYQPWAIEPISDAGVPGDDNMQYTLQLDQSQSSSSSSSSSSSGSPISQPTSR